MDQYLGSLTMRVRSSNSEIPNNERFKTYLIVCRFCDSGLIQIFQYVPIFAPQHSWVVVTLVKKSKDRMPKLASDQKLLFCCCCSGISLCIWHNHKQRTLGNPYAQNRRNRPVGSCVAAVVVVQRKECRSGCARRVALLI